MSPGSSAIEPVEIAAGGLTLRPWSEADAPALFDAFAQPHIVRWNARLPLPDLAAAEERLDVLRRSWQEGTGASWAVRASVGGELLGSVRIRDIDAWQGSAVASYWVLDHAQGRGVATGALCAATRWAFGALRLHRVDLTHADVNTASCRVAEKAGYRQEAVLRRSEVLADGRHDEHLHGRLATDPEP